MVFSLKRMRRLWRIAFSERSFRLMRLSILELRHSAFATVHSLDCSGVSDTSSPSSVCTLPGSPALKVLSTFAGTYISSSLGIHTHESTSNVAILGAGDTCPEWPAKRCDQA